MPVAEFVDVPHEFIEAHDAAIRAWLHNSDWNEQQLTISAKPPESFRLTGRPPIAEHVTLIRSPFRPGTVLVQPKNDHSRDVLVRWARRHRAAAA